MKAYKALLIIWLKMIHWNTSIFVVCFFFPLSSLFFSSFVFSFFHSERNNWCFNGKYEQVPCWFCTPYSQSFQFVSLISKKKTSFLQLFIVNNLGDEGAKILLKGIRKCKQIEELYLQCLFPFSPHFHNVLFTFSSFLNSHWNWNCW